MVSATLTGTSLIRPIESYAKVQHLVGKMVRGRRFQLRRRRIRKLVYVDLGCGLNTHEDFINMDFLWHSKVDVCWDISRGLPFSNASMKGIFTEHCLEHFSLPMAVSILKECRRLLAPGGILRIVVPDGEAYLRTYCRQLQGDDSVRFPFQESESLGGVYSPILSVNRVFYQDRDSLNGHRFIFDFDILQRLLRRCGFNSVSRVQFRQGSDSTLLIDTAARAPESLYVEAIVAGED